MSAYDVRPTPVVEDEVSLGMAEHTLPPAPPVHVPPPRVSPAWLEENGPTSDLYQHYTEPASPFGGFFDRLRTRDGVQIDKYGIGGSTEDLAIRFLPILPYLTD